MLDNRLVILDTAIRASTKPVKSELALDQTIGTAIKDIREGLLAHKAWRAFAANDVAQRHRRALLGRFWIVAAMAIAVAAIGSVYARVMQVPASSYVPFIAAGLVVWYLISAVLAESPTVFAGSEGFIKAVYVPKTFFVARLIYKNTIIFIANLVVVAAVTLIYPPESIGSLLFLPIGFMLVIINLFWIALILGTLATRYRDIAPLTISVMQVMFLITPVIYHPDQLAQDLNWITYVNPLANLMSMLRDPMLGQWPGAIRISICAAMGAAGSLVALLVFARARPMIVLWI
jgi:ABC-type polysaccharide/polyol phosphate export permease